MFRGRKTDKEAIEALMASYAEEVLQCNQKLKELRESGKADSKEYMMYVVEAEKAGKSYEALNLRYMRTYYPEEVKAKPMSKEELILRIAENGVRILGIGVCVWQSFALKQWEEEGGFFMRKNVITARMPDPYH